ncbi:hypothetical protein M3202_15525 [Alkalihalobacillus oceani]|uniref:Uncharacterized protein n=1 Tax=Halalkalibacter oceani TaxID=1653776 RepID=A0A9X2DR01_9BACI|nr:hypothetical protein [Halalkalibacter oceani]MCM3715479.1 hypothetical protein [Halalkalibacter oceani]
MDRTLELRFRNELGRTIAIRVLHPREDISGKSRIVNYLYTHLQKEKSKTLVSPFSAKTTWIQVYMVYGG